MRVRIIGSVVCFATAAVLSKVAEKLFPFNELMTIAGTFMKKA
jgi:hypothetical protein